MWKHGFIVREVHLVVTDSVLASSFYALLLNTKPVIVDGGSYFNIEGSRFLVREDPQALRPPSRFLRIISCGLCCRLARGSL